MPLVQSCFHVNFVKILRASFFIEHPRWLLLVFSWIRLFFLFIEFCFFILKLGREVPSNLITLHLSSFNSAYLKLLLNRKRDISSMVSMYAAALHCVKKKNVAYEKGTFLVGYSFTFWFFSQMFHKSSKFWSFSFFSTMQTVYYYYSVVLYTNTVSVKQ